MSKKTDYKLWEKYFFHYDIVMQIINSMASWCINLMVAAYRATLGHFMGGHCRFQPTCSQYMLDAVTKYGPWIGFYKGIKRICRCHPWGGCGHDPA